MESTNLDIQVFKFFYSWVIVVYHLAASTAVTFKGGYCGVEYFLLTAGVFLFLSFEKGEKVGKQRTPGAYLSKRFKRFFPWSITAFFFCVIVEHVILNPVTSVADWMDLFSSDIWEILMVKWNGMNNNEYLLNGPAWTLSAMLIVGFFIWTFLFHCQKAFINLIMPLTLVLGFGYWMHLPSADTESWMGITTFGTFRTYLVMCLGYYCILMGRKLAQIPFNKLGKIILFVFEVLIHVFALVVMAFRAERYYQWLLTLLFMVSIAIAMSGHSYIAKALDGLKTAKLLGDLSMSIYLIHTPVIRLFRTTNNMEACTYIDLIPLFVVVLIAAICHCYLTKWLIRWFPKFWNRLIGLVTV